MKEQALPASWTAFRSSATLMLFAGAATGQRMTRSQFELIAWELAKYGACFHEIDLRAVFDDAAAFLGIQADADDLEDPRAFARFHGGIILQRRGREALNHALSAAARVAARVEHDQAAVIHTLVHDASVHAPSTTTYHWRGQHLHFGRDEAQDHARFEYIPGLPDAAETAARIRGVVDVLVTPRGWSHVHALAFLFHAARAADLAAPEPLPAVAFRLLGTFVDDDELADVLADAAMVFDHCGGRRFVVLRAVEDQLMHFVGWPASAREAIVAAVNRIASVQLTAFRRAIITAAMAVLATSPKALPRPYEPPMWRAPDPP